MSETICLKNEVHLYGTRRKSIAIMSVYDPDGIIDDYIIYYLNSLKKVTERIIVAVNGQIDLEGESKLQKVADDIFIRPNKGFDFGAYKDVIDNYLPYEIWDKYEEIILCNDTCFGPFVPFETIFDVMDRRGLQFWSINYRDNLLLPYYESYFMVFSGKALGLLKSFFRETVDDSITEISYAQGYEHSLSELIMQQKILSGFYTSGQETYPNLDIYKAPDYAIEYLGLPFLKKRCFSPKIMQKDNCCKALNLIQKNTDYPIEYIFRSISRNYGLDMEKENIEAPNKSFPHSFWKFYISHQELISFCRKHKKVYLYGKGYMSVFILARFRRYMNEFSGYIVSDGHYTKEMEADRKTYPLSMIDKSAPIIVALLEKNTQDVKETLKGYPNAVFLSVPNNL